MKIEQIKEISALNSKLEELNAAYCNPDNEFSIRVSRRESDMPRVSSRENSGVDSQHYITFGSLSGTVSHTVFTGPEVKNFLHTLIQQIEQKLKDLGAIL